jgi:hypothetical protein
MPRTAIKLSLHETGFELGCMEMSVRLVTSASMISGYFQLPSDRNRFGFDSYLDFEDTTVILDTFEGL